MLTFNDIITNEILANGFVRGTVPLCDYIINGSFKHWLDNTGVTFTSTQARAYYTATLFVQEVNGDGNVTTSTISRKSHATGQTDIPTASPYYLRHAVTSGGAANEYIFIRQYIEDAMRLNNKQITVSIWARAQNDSTYLGIEMEQFGFTVDTRGIGSTKVKLSTEWSRYDFTIDMPSLDGKTVLSTAPYYSLNLWCSAGSSLNTRSGYIGLQSGTFDIAKIQMIDGPVYRYVPERAYADEMALIGRFYEKSYDDDVMPGAITESGCDMISTIGTNDGHHYFNVRYKHKHRVSTGLRTYSPVTGAIDAVRASARGSGTYNGDASVAIQAPSQTGCILYAFSYDAMHPSVAYFHYVKDSRF